MMEIVSVQRNWIPLEPIWSKVIFSLPLIYMWMWNGNWVDGWLHL